MQPISTRTPYFQTLKYKFLWRFFAVALQFAKMYVQVYHVSLSIEENSYRLLDNKVFLLSSETA